MFTKLAKGVRHKCRLHQRRRRRKRQSVDKTHLTTRTACLVYHWALVGLDQEGKQCASCQVQTIPPNGVEPWLKQRNSWFACFCTRRAGYTTTTYTVFALEGGNHQCQVQMSPLSGVNHIQSRDTDIFIASVQKFSVWNFEA